ncbi:MAG TPA: alpha/beta hydrolase, partial [Mycobacterium sp.]|nr:alpha/beta hydrolase [Mycobacterium sp.]
MTNTPTASGTPGVTREFVGMDSPTSRRAGSGGHPCQGL